MFQRAIAPNNVTAIFFQLITARSRGGGDHLKVGDEGERSLMRSLVFQPREKKKKNAMTVRLAIFRLSTGQRPETRDFDTAKCV